MITKDFEFKKGQKFLVRQSENNVILTVMAVEDKYAMIRFKGCLPFVKSTKSLVEYLNSLTSTLMLKNKI